MSALPPLPSTSIPSSTTPQAASASSEQGDPAVSFEAVLEAQLGVVPGPQAVFLPEAEKSAERVGADVRGVDESKPADAPVDAAAQFLFLPSNLPGIQPVVSTVPVTAGDALLPVRDDRQAATKALPAPGALPTELETPPPEQLAAPVPVSGSRQTEPANFAAELQRLPGLAPRSEPEPTTGAQPVAPESLVPNANRRLEAAPPAQNQASAIPGTVGEARWGEALSQRVVWMVGQQVRAAEFRVEPPQLGPIEVRLSITNDQANLTFAAPHAAARDAIQTSLPRLQEMLLESGLSLGNVFVGAQTQQDPREPATGNRDSSSASGAISTAREAGALSAEATVQVRHSLGLVDLYA
jgi:flagellar hook-length control protein FliK